MLSLKTEMQNAKRNVVVKIDTGTEVSKTFSILDIPVVSHNVYHPCVEAPPLQATR